MLNASRIAPLEGYDGIYRYFHILSVYYLSQEKALQGDKAETLYTGIYWYIFLIVIALRGLLSHHRRNAIAACQDIGDYALSPCKV